MSDRQQTQFVQWVKDYRDFLYRAAWAITGKRAAAQDLVQETFALAWRARHQLRDGAAVQGWLYRILQRQAIRNWRAREQAENWDAAECERAPDQATDGSMRFDLMEALQALSPQHREILVLFYLADLNYSEMAQALELPAGTVMSRLNRARAALRQLLGEEYMK
ncbi:MAG: RNA polymerase sigma factor [Gammaproteobacteria bacterium]|nr:RNA polymerase sigma factor [Gammaproteobacteria bacterium]